MTTNRQNSYTPEQIGNAEQMARLLKSVPSSQENILVIMGNVFLSGLEAGMQMAENKKAV